MSDMTRDEATALRAAAATDARLLSRKPKHELCAIIASEDGHPCGHSSDYGHWSKDELVAGILDRRGFGVARLNEAMAAVTA